MGGSVNFTNQNNFIASEAFGAIATIDLDAIVENYKALATMIAPTQCSAVIKANAYGLGAKYVGPALYQAGCRVFFVAQLIEAIELQTYLPNDVKIAILNGVQQNAEEQTAKSGFIPVLNSFDAIESWNHLCLTSKQKFSAIVQIDTGMNRLGLDQDDLKKLIQTPDIFKTADILYIMSHLASGDEAETLSNKQQLNALNNALKKLPKCKIAFANSGGIFLDQDYNFDLARPGIALYGIQPHGSKPNIIKPVLQLSARVIQTRNVKKGLAIGYSGSFITKRDSHITTIAIGYADGWHRYLGNKGSVYFHGRKIPIIGRISMDSITLDITDLEGLILKRGDLVELIGSHQTLEDVARDADTIPYEILTSLSNRCERIYIQNGKRIKS